MLGRVLLAAAWWYLGPVAGTGAAGGSAGPAPLVEVSRIRLTSGGALGPVNGPAWPGEPLLSAAADVRLRPWPGGHLQVHIASFSGLSQGVPTGLGPLQWVGDAGSSRVSGGQQLVRRTPLEVGVSGRAGATGCRLWWGAGPVSAEGSAAEAIATESADWEATRLWSGRGTEASAGALWHRPLGRGWAAGFEAAAGGGQWTGPLEQRTTTRLYPDMTREALGRGSASAGRDWGSIVGMVAHVWPAGQVTAGLGWAGERQWGQHRTGPEEVRVTYGDGSTRTLSGARGEENRFDARWEGLVLPLQARWLATPYLAVIASAAGWWGTLTEHAATDRHVYVDGRVVGEQPLVRTDGRRPSSGWTWRLGVAVVVGGGTSWRLEVGPGGRFAMALEALA